MLGIGSNVGFGRNEGDEQRAVYGLCFPAEGGIDFPRVTAQRSSDGWSCGMSSFRVPISTSQAKGS